MRKLIVAVFFTGLSLVLTHQGYSQVKQPQIYISSYSTIATQDHQPLWISANRFGMFDEYKRSNNVFLLSGNSILKKEALFDYAYGVDVLARGSGNSSTLYVHQAYLSGKAGILQVDIGRKEQTWGEHFAELSSGSLALSRNATPLPLINISVPEYTPVPFTYELIQFRGNLAHGWLEDSRHVKDAYLHQKSIYLQAGLSHWPVQAYGGMIHVVQWGGESPRYGKLPGSLSDFPKIFFGKSADENDESAPGGEINNALGNHLGIWDFGFKGKAAGYKYHLYWQHFFEDHSGLVFRNLGDGLFGFGVSTESKNIINGVLLEYVRTKKQTGPGLHGRPGDFPFCEEENCGYKYGGRDNYYNNGLYRSGWSYNGNILGNPLLMTSRQIETYLPDAVIYENMVESNRVAAHHFGIEGAITTNLQYRALITYTLHHGSYGGKNFGQRFGSKNPENNLEDYAFYPALKQWNFMLENRYRVDAIPRIEFLSTIALDRGELTDNFGVMIGVRWKVRGFNE